MCSGEPQNLHLEDLTLASLDLLSEVGFSMEDLLTILGLAPLLLEDILWGRMSVLEIVFVGQCAVFVCLGFVSLFLPFCFFP